MSGVTIMQVCYKTAILWKACNITYTYRLVMCFSCKEKQDIIGSMGLLSTNPVVYSLWKNEYLSPSGSWSENKIQFVQLPGHALTYDLGK